MRSKPAFIIATVLSSVFAAACSEITTPPTVAVAPVHTVATLTCSASVQSRSVACQAPSTGAPGAANVIFGGQNQFVKLISSNVQILADTFAFDVTVTNLLPQTLGTTNGTTKDPAGVRVFFNSGPTAAGGGSIAVVNADDAATFTGPGQFFFQYDGFLSTNFTSAPKTWKLQFSPGVTSFNFTLLVSAEVQYPDGYVDETPYVLTLDPGEARTLTGTSRNYLGIAYPADVIDWVSNAPATAAVAGSLVTAGLSRGFASLTATSGSKPALWPTQVSVCQSAVVANGANVPSSIASTDCFSSFGSNKFTPTTSYYADLYRVTLTAGQTITVTMDSGDHLDTYLILAAPVTGRAVSLNDDDDEGTLGVGSRIVYTAPVSGVYVIEASTFDSLATGAYTLHVTIT